MPPRSTSGTCCLEIIFGPCLIKIDIRLSSKYIYIYIYIYIQSSLEWQIKWKVIEIHGEMEKRKRKRKKNVSAMSLYLFFWGSLPLLMLFNELSAKVSSAIYVNYCCFSRLCVYLRVSLLFFYFSFSLSSSFFALSSIIYPFIFFAYKSVWFLKRHYLVFLSFAC
jgi:hypothetical protein